MIKSINQQLLNIPGSYSVPTGYRITMSLYINKQGETEREGVEVETCMI